MIATRKPTYQPVKYDVSIHRNGGSNWFTVEVTEDSEVTTFTRHSLDAAQRTAATLRPDVCECGHVPFSVFYPGGP